MAVEIRSARLPDVEGVRAVANEAWRATHAPIIGTDAVESFLDEHYDAETFRSNVEDDDTIFDVAAVDDIVGFVTARPAADGTTFALGRIYVTPDYWATESDGGCSTTRSERCDDAPGRESNSASWPRTTAP